MSAGRNSVPQTVEAISPAVRAAARAAPSRAASWAAAGGILGGLASISCCILPLILFVLGVSGAWIANLTALGPYQPVFFAATVGCLAVGYVRVYRRPDLACAEGACARPLPRRVVKGALWTATSLVAAAIAFRYLAPFLLTTS
jgi:mercuric ion transport protein